MPPPNSQGLTLKAKGLTLNFEHPGHQQQLQQKNEKRPRQMNSRKNTIKTKLRICHAIKY